MTPIPILHLITELSAGGAQSALFRLLANSDRETYPPRVACLFNGQGVIARQLRALGIPVSDLRFKPDGSLGGMWRLYRLLRSHRPVILQTWMFHADFLGRLAGTAAGVPLIVGSRRNVNIGGRRREYLNRWTSPLQEKVIAVCEAARSIEIQQTGVPPQKVITIYNGIDPAQFQTFAGSSENRQPLLKTADPAFLVGAAGRLHPQKGFSILVEAFQQLSQDSVDLRLIIAGEGELGQEIASQIARSGLSERVTMAGYWEPMETFYQSLDLFVSASLWEGLPNVILEAMASGVPVVATRVGGTPELVIDGETGLLVPPGEAGALAAAIKTLRENPDLRGQMGTAGKQRVRKAFSIQKTVRETEALYEALLATL